MRIDGNSQPQATRPLPKTAKRSGFSALVAGAPTNDVPDAACGSATGVMSTTLVPGLDLTTIDDDNSRERAHGAKCGAALLDELGALQRDMATGQLTAGRLQTISNRLSEMPRPSDAGLAAIIGEIELR
ncbi:MAG: flagellar assembly protein FliX, partial [Pseudomonadota bacterium]